MGPATIDRNAAYRREARRIRGRLADSPVERYAALRELSHRHDATSEPRDPASALFRSPHSVFGQLASEQIGDSDLPYSRRLDLLNTAQKLGIGRFEANLMIAAVQHRAGRTLDETERSSHLPISRTVPLLAFLLIQSLIVAGVWGIFLR